MENGQETIKTEVKTDPTSDEVMDIKPAAEATIVPKVEIVEKTEEKASQKASEKSSEKPSEKPAEKLSEQASNESSDKPSDKPSEKPSDKPTDNATEPPSDRLLEKIKNQIEFYFGNVNMQRDKFLIEQAKLDDGWIPMTVMLKFKLLASFSKDADVILKALETSDLMEVSEDKTKIRRSPKHPLPVYDEEYRQAQQARTIYLKGFPLTDIYVQKLKAFFEPYEPFENIIMRKYQDSEKKLQFKGSIFIQFKTLEDAKAFMEREPVKYEGTELIRKWANDYAAEKAKEKVERRQRKTEGKGNKTENVEDKEDDDEKDEEENKDSGLPKGSLLQFTGTTEALSREEIKERLEALDASVAFIEWKKGDSEGWVRLQGENGAKPLLEKMDDGKIAIKEDELTFRILEGEEEEKYLAKAKEEMANIRHKNNKMKRGGKRGRGSQRGGRKRRNSPGRDGVPAKKVAVE